MEIQCEFVVNSRNQYECHVNSLAITQRCEVSSFKGKHKKRKTDKDVESLEFHNAKMKYLPSGLSRIFPSLKALQIRNCELEEISSNDLIGFDNLEELRIGYNNLMSLPDDLLIHTKKLRMININDVNLEVMSSRLLDSFPDGQLKYVSFYKEPSVNAVYWLDTEGSLESIEQLKAKIDLLWSPQVFAPIKTRNTINEFSILWEERKYSDFIIVVGSMEIPVHKCVLSTLSPVFAEMFKNDPEVVSSNKLEIKECSGYVVEEFLSVLYKGEVTNEENALDLFSLACTFEVEELKKVYWEIAIRYVNEQNATKALTIGNLHKSAEMIDAAFSLIKMMWPNEIQSEALKYQPKRVEEIIMYKQMIDDLNHL
jgi:BTB/POZ domain